MTKPSPKSKNHKLKRWPMIGVGSLMVLFVVTVLAFEISPWPGAILVRAVFNHGSRQTRAALQKYMPSVPITVISDQQYKSGDKHALLDVYLPESIEQAGRSLPVLVWTHGGGWVSGDKTDDGPYFQLIAAQGFGVVSLNYSLAPEKTYPTQIFELNTAYAYIAANAARLHLDPSKVFLAGDSAGSQLSAQMAALITNPAYAQELDIKPSLSPAQLKGVVLFCGIYNEAGLTEADPNLPWLISWGDDQVVWAYSGTKNQSSPVIHQMSPYYYVTKNFPTTFISGGNGDPLTNKQSVPLAQKLSTLGVNLTMLFYPPNHQPSLPHEYQFNLASTDGKKAFHQMLDFLHHNTSEF